MRKSIFLLADSMQRLIMLRNISMHNYIKYRLETITKEEYMHILIPIDKEIDILETKLLGYNFRCGL